MSHARDLKKPPPEVLFVVWMEGPFGLDGEPAPEGSYRIHWSEKHALNWWEKARASGRKARMIMYRQGPDMMKQLEEPDGQETGKT